ncbi:hypothetical protein BT96DRAFT_949077 [Gymnopus androsaceus JB14]|uniref:Zn(2)-C6 fungal-type domain-containing protein n=1 Tax=Gymnopus androsaceus JB14 TaxID=1447944 RepID=A0A6A4GMD3_9AGAR|nr:hypothetical protein BT96DRAFT_949077 [Gymnopus androsaceus JB14]
MLNINITLSSPTVDKVGDNGDSNDNGEGSEDGKLWEGGKKDEESDEEIEQESENVDWSGVNAVNPVGNDVRDIEGRVHRSGSVSAAHEGAARAASPKEIQVGDSFPTRCGECKRWALPCTWWSSTGTLCQPCHKSKVKCLHSDGMKMAQKKKMRRTGPEGLVHLLVTKGKGKAREESEDEEEDDDNNDEGEE